MTPLLTFALGLIFQFPVHAQAPSGPPPAKVRVGLVLRKSVQEHRLVIGQVEPAKRTIVAAEEKGRVKIAPPEPGTPVKGDATIASVDSTLLDLDKKAADLAVLEAKIATDEAAAQVAEQQARLTTAARDRKRLEKLVTTQVAKRHELDNAVDAESAARARLSFFKALQRRATAVHQRALITAKRLETQILKTKVIAPFSGYIVRKHTEVGQWVDAGDPVAEIVMTQTVKVRLEVPQAIIPKLKPGQSVTVRFDALFTSKTEKIFSIVPDGDAQSRTFRVLLKFKNADSALKPGMSVAAELPTGNKTQALTVPRDAVNLTPNGAIVFVNRGGMGLPVNVAIRFGDGDRYVIRGPLRDGDQVVVEGNERLIPGQRLIVLNDPNKPAPNRKKDKGE